MLRNTERDRKDALLRLHVWLLNYNNHELQRSHVAEELLDDVSGISQSELKHKFHAVEKPRGKIITDRARDAAAGRDPDEAPRRVAVKKRRLQ